MSAQAGAGKITSFCVTEPLVMDMTESVNTTRGTVRMRINNETHATCLNHLGTTGSD